MIKHPTDSTLNALLCVAFAAVVSSCAAAPRAPTTEATAQLERLKRLDGAWVTINGSPEMPAGAEVRYRVTGGGSAVVETLFPATPHEMVSVYHLADGQLVMTHYCAVGNQPYMVARPSADASRLVFECVGGANVDRKRGLFMGRAEFEFVDDARINATWSAVKDGKPDHQARFELVRSWK